MMHYSVLKDELIKNLNIKENGIYVDATLGYAGDAKEILKRIKKGYLYAFDADKNAVAYSTSELSKISENFRIFNDNFVNLKQDLEEKGVFKVDGIIFDLGFSSPEIDSEDKGLSFMKDGILDMRYSGSGKSAKNIIDEYATEELTKVFYTYGEEKLSKVIATYIKKHQQEIVTTFDLVEAIKSSVGANYFYKEHPERKIFQALRIETNNELGVLENALKDAVEMLTPGGRIEVITFHSLEDRVVKNSFKAYSEVPEPFKGEPTIPEMYQPKIKLINRKPILPSEKELQENTRSHSAKLRIGERL